MSRVRSHYVRVQKRRIGDSWHHYVTIPSRLARELGIEKGDIVEMSLETRGDEKVLIVRVAAKDRRLAG